MTIRNARKAIRKTKTGYGSYANPSSFWSSTTATADIADRYGNTVRVAEGGKLKDFGGILSFQGRIETVRGSDSWSTVERALQEQGEIIQSNMRSCEELLDTQQLYIL